MASKTQDGGPINAPETWEKMYVLAKSREPSLGITGERLPPPQEPKPAERVKTEAET